MDSIEYIHIRPENNQDKVSDNICLISKDSDYMFTSKYVTFEVDGIPLDITIDEDKFENGFRLHLENNSEFKAFINYDGEKIQILGGVAQEGGIKTTYERPISLELARLIYLKAVSTRDVNDILNKNNIGNDLKTDLHTHFGSALPAADLIKIALDCNAVYPKHLLDSLLGRKSYSNVNGLVHLQDLSEDELSLLRKKMDINFNKEITFSMMEDIYKYRGPLTKNKDMFIPMLEQIARRNSAIGIKRSEYSFSGITDPEYLKLIDDNIEGIEEKYGVSIGFLAGLWRHSDREWNDYEIDKIKSIIEHPYLSGIDFMGHESNSSKDLIEQIDGLVKLTKEKRPDFVYRFHAGETSFVKSNVEDVVEFAKKSGVNVRIGHGIYGMTKEIMTDISKQDNVTVEFNPVSNVSLNHSNNFSYIKSKIKDFISSGGHCVIGTDGEGMYKTTPQGQSNILQLSRAQHDIISDFESNYIGMSLSAQERLKKRKWKNYYERLHHVSEPTHFSSTTIYKSNINSIERRLKDIGVPVISDDDVRNMAKNKEPLLFSGASSNSWAEMTDAEKRNSIDGISLFLKNKNRDNFFVVTGGTNIGFEREVHKIARSMGFDVVGTITSDANPNDLESDTVTAVTIIGKDDNIPTNWFDKSPFVIDLIRNNRGSAVFAGGGQVIRDEIYSLLNEDYFEPYDKVTLIKDTGGATDEAINKYGQHNYKKEKNMKEKDINWDDSVDVISSSSVVKFIIPVPHEKGDPLVYPDGENKGKPIADWEGNPVGEDGIVFYNGVDNCVQAVPSNGTGVIILNNISQEEARVLKDYQLSLESNEITGLDSIKGTLKKAEDLGIKDMYNSDTSFVLSKMKTYHGDELDGKVTSGMYRRDDRDICQAVYIEGKGTFEGAAASEQKFEDGAFIVKQGDSVRLVQADVFLDTYRDVNGNEINISIFGSTFDDEDAMSQGAEQINTSFSTLDNGNGEIYPLSMKLSDTDATISSIGEGNQLSKEILDNAEHLRNSIIVPESSGLNQDTELGFSI